MSRNCRKKCNCTKNTLCLVSQMVELWCICCHMTCHNVVTWPVTMLSHDLSQCCHMTSHNLVTWPVTVLSHGLSWCCHWSVTMLSHGLSQCCHINCHGVVTWSIMMSHDLSRDLPVTWLTSVQCCYIPDMWHASQIWCGRVLLLTTLCVGGKCQ